MIITRAAMDAVYNSFRADYEAGMLAVKPMKDRIATTTRSGGKEETYGWLGNYASMREWLGQKVMNNLVTSGFSIKNRTFENTVTVPREDIEDDRIGVFSGAFKMLGQDAALHPDELIFDLLRNGTQRLCYDGQNFFDTDHPSDPENPSSGSVSNADMATPQGVPSWVLLDTTKVIKPFIFQLRRDYSFIRKDRAEDDNVFFGNEYIYGVEARVNAGYGLWQLAYASDKDLDEERFASARAAMMSLKAPTGKPLGVSPDLLLVAPGLDRAARHLLNLDTSVYKGAMELVVCPWMA